MKLLVVKGSGGGGLGDSIRVVLQAILYAKVSGRALYVDWRHGLLGPRGENVFHRLFRLRDIASAGAIPDTESVLPQSWRSRVQKSLDDVYVEDGAPPWDRAKAIAKYSADLSKIDHPEKVLFVWDFDQLDAIKPHLPGDMREWDNDVLFSKTYDEYLEVDEAIIESVKQSWCFDGAEQVIGVHIRMTEEYTANKGAVTLSNYASAIRSARQEYPDAPIFLATDNTHCEDWIRARFESVFTRPKWFNLPGQPLHLGSDCPDRLRATSDALVEMLMLSRCDYLIRPADSSFSLVSRLIGQSHGIREVAISNSHSRYRKLLRRLAKKVLK